MLSYVLIVFVFHFFPSQTHSYIWKNPVMVVIDFCHKTFRFNFCCKLLGYKIFTWNIHQKRTFICNILKHNILVGIYINIFETLYQFLRLNVCFKLYLMKSIFCSVFWRESRYVDFYNQRFSVPINSLFSLWFKIASTIV